MTKMTALQPFHLAFLVHDLEEARTFYCGVLGCATGRESDTWIDFDFWGHQVVAHLAHGDGPQSNANRPMTNQVDGKHVPAPHFGVVLGWDEWHALRDKLAAAKLKFVIEPYIRFEGLPGEQATMFVMDPSGNALEFKSFKDIGQLFAKD